MFRDATRLLRLELAWIDNDLKRAELRGIKFVFDSHPTTHRCQSRLSLIVLLLAMQFIRADCKMNRSRTTLRAEVNPGNSDVHIRYA
jgi:hypothetical protein